MRVAATATMTSSHFIFLEWNLITRMKVIPRHVRAAVGGQVSRSHLSTSNVLRLSKGHAHTSTMRMENDESSGESQIKISPTNRDAGADL